MRQFRTSMTVFAAALYVLLGISASWHAPHFSRGEVNVGVDAHAGEHETALDGESCALCSSKTASQESFVPASFAPLAHDAGPAKLSESGSTARGDFRADRARAPPFVS